MLRIGCYILAALLLGGAGAYLIWGQDKGLGIFFVLIAAVLCRVLIINVVGHLEDRSDRENQPTDDA